MKFDIRKFFENVSIMFKFHENLTTVIGALYKDLRKFMAAFRCIRGTR